MNTFKVNSLREIDKLVAQYIFDWSVFSYLELGYKLTGIYKDKRENVPYYSNNIFNAYEVLNYFPFYTLEKTNSSYNKWRYRCYLCCLDEYEIEICAPTAELAICLAALKVKGIEVIYEE